MQSLDIISVNIWNILWSLVNLLILFLILKRFLFKPVTKVMNERQAQVTAIYADAENDRQAAADMKQEYETRMATAREEADGLVRNAVQTAQRKSDAILAEFKAMLQAYSSQKINELTVTVTKYVYKAQNVCVVGDAKIASVLVLNNIVRADDYENLGNRFEL